MQINRRSFLKTGLCALGTMGILGRGMPAWSSGPAIKGREASHYEVLPDGRLHCLLCPKGCTRSDGERCCCGVREARDGKFITLSYGLPCVLAIDPVEKCPLFHFRLPGPGFSIATAGCNLACDYCQNWQFSQKPPEETNNFEMSPEEVIKKALEYKASAVSFFYTEPIVYFEFMRDIARLAKKAGLATVMVTAGYINPGPLQELFPLIDAFVVGLKGYNDGFYKKTIGGTLEPVLNTLQAVAKAGKHLEIVTLLVPTLNDNMEDIKSEAGWIVKTIGTDVPLHFTRFNPQFRLKTLPPTPVAVLDRARTIALQAGIKFVYTGNIPGHEGNHTFCPSCKKILIERLGFQVLKNVLQNGACPYCQARIPGRW